MHYYKFNIADYRADTGHLSVIEHGIYRQLIDWYYLESKPIPLETSTVMRRLRLGFEHEQLLINVLQDFFVKTEIGYTQTRIERELSEYADQVDKNRSNGKRGGRPIKTKVEPINNPSGFQTKPKHNPNHKPLTNNHKPKDNKYSAEFESAWGLYPRRPGASKADSYKSWNARVKEGVDPQLMIDGVVRYARYCNLSQTGQQFIKQPATFFGIGEHYLSRWDYVPAQQSTNNRRAAVADQIMGGSYGRINTLDNFAEARPIASSGKDIPAIAPVVWESDNG